ncbi:Tellurite resistance protein TerB [Beggiatoa alba B18LD]|uniref:Tellurite resistance protein TerB n=1 Tax=Beggiatoa alba B18LD TaxID=395493 RepID=I3CG37_9GAMM|nr:TerB family tellurite resistance protein [Beggiatoa alba]EIJ42580.1 Tellurite resistance protein TerB [Beggiatoa alba B18LD]
MGMFDFLGIGTVISGAGGVALGATIMGVMKGRKLDKLEERLGGADTATQERVIRKIAILKTLAYRDGDFSPIERIFIYRYILGHNELSTDTKVALALDLDEPLPATFSSMLDRLRALVSFSDLFISQEEAIGFIWVMRELASVDGSFDKDELEYIQKICKDCKVPAHAIPSEQLLLTDASNI